MNRQQYLEAALKDPLAKEHTQKYLDWFKDTELIELPGGAMLLKGNEVHLRIEDGANKTAFIRSLKGAVEIAFKTRKMLIGLIPLENKKMIRIAEWHGFRKSGERNGHIELRRYK